MNAAIRWALSHGRTVVPLLELSIAARGIHVLEVDHFTPGGVDFPGRKMFDVVKGGWAPITYGSSLDGTALQRVQTKVTVPDLDRRLRSMLETYNARGSAARIYWACPELTVADWEPLFVGILYDWIIADETVTLLLRVDDSLLATSVPRDIYSRTCWPEAADLSILDTPQQLAFGVFDGEEIAAGGMVEATNVRWSATRGYLWQVSASYLHEVTRVYADGTLVSGGSWSVLRAVYGGVRETLISYAAAAKTTKVTCDLEGPDATGEAAGEPLRNPVRILRVAGEEYAFRSRPALAWLGAHPLIHDASWETVANIFDRMGIECGIVLGGSRSAATWADLLREFLERYPWVTASWTPLGQIHLDAIDVDDPEPPSEYLDAAAVCAGGKMPFEPADRGETFNVVVQPYLYSPAQGKYLSQVEADDLTLGVTAHSVSTITGRFCQGRLRVPV